MERRGTPFATALGALVAAVGLAAATPPGDPAVRGLQAWLDGTRTLEGRFVQTLESGALGAGVEERGKFWIERPGRMRWDYAEPERKVALVDGDRTWLYLAEDNQLVLGRLSEQGDLLPALLTGSGRIDELFEASTVAGDGAGPEVRLEPRGTDEVERIVLRLDPRTYAIREAEVVDAAGNRMRYRFENVRRNRDLPEDAFGFRPPEDAIVTGSHDS